MREFGRGPGTGQGAASLAARDDIAIAIQRTRQIRLTVGEGHGGRRSVGNALQIGSKRRVEGGEQLSADISGGGEDEGVSL